jgi:hypothetical protein
MLSSTLLIVCGVGPLSYSTKGTLWRLASLIREEIFLFEASLMDACINGDQILEGDWPLGHGVVPNFAF